MAARFALSFALQQNKTNDLTVDDWQLIRSPELEGQRRTALSSPKGAFKTLRTWWETHDSRAHIDQVMDIRSKTFVGQRDRRRERTNCFQLDGGAFVMSGTTADLTTALKNGFGYGVDRFVCDELDELVVSYVRVTKIGATQTVVHIAPQRSWWRANAEFGLEKWNEPEKAGWHRRLPNLWPGEPSRGAPKLWTDYFTEHERWLDNIRDTATIDIAAKHWKS